MATRRGTIELVIEGITRGLGRATTEADAATRRVEAAEERVNRARVQSENNAGRLAVAEQRLEQVRAAQGAATQRISDQETRINEARARSEQAAARLGQAETNLENLRRNGGSAREISAAEQEINRVRRESEAASRQLGQAETALENLRRQQGASALRVAQAEEAVARARRNGLQGSRDLAEAEAELARRRGELEQADSRGGPLRSFFAGIARGVNPVRALAGLIGDVTTRMGGFGQALSAIGGPIIEAVVGLIQMAAVMAGIVEVVGIIGGVIGQALGGVPALLLAVAAAGITVALGLDGIKNAANVLDPAMQKLRKSVSDVFEKNLTPVFKQLAGLLPQLTGGFDRIALAISGFVKELVAVATTVRGVQELQAILAATAPFVDRLGVGIASFLDGLIRAAAAAAPAFGALGGALGSIFDKIGAVFAKLADNGVILKAVQGLAATIDGLGAVLGPVIELLIRMGAALGNSVGIALTSLGAGIEKVIPFFEHLADVAGRVLVDAINQLGPPLAQLADSILPGAGQGLEGFATLMHNVVLPAIADFINFLRTDAIPGLLAFTHGAIVQLTGFASGLLTVVSGLLGTLHDTFAALALIPGPMQVQFAQAAASLDHAKGSVDGFKASVDAIHDKEIKIAAQANGAKEVENLRTTIDSVHDKIVKTVSTAFGLGPNKDLTAAIDAVHDAVHTTTSNVFGTNENNALTGAIDRVHDTTKKSLSNVFGRPENDALTAAIDKVHDKTVAVVANVSGTSAVNGLISAISNVVSKTVSVTVNTIQRTLGFAEGGLAPGGMPIVVGEKGPELIVLPKGGGFVFTNAQTRGILGGQASASPVGSSSGGGGGDPITVNVAISQEAIAGIARVEIVSRDRATKRTVLAGSGATF